MGIRCLLLAFLVLTALPAPAAFITNADLARFGTQVSHLQAAMADAHRALDDRAPDDLRDALESLRTSLLQGRSRYALLRAIISQRTNRLYDQNQKYGEPQLWPDAQFERLDQYRQEAADITSAAETEHFMLDQTTDCLEALHHARQEGVDPLADSYDMFHDKVGELDERFSTYKEQIDGLHKWL